MKFKRGLCALLILGSAVTATPSLRAADPGYGTISGQFVLDGAVPEPTLIFKKGDPTAKDPAVCAAADLFANDLVVDSKSKGIANIFIYLRKARNVHPDLLKTPDAQREVVFDQKGCRFIPHAMVVRTDQIVVVKSGDNCFHNTHTFPLRNSARNFGIAANDRTGVKMEHPRAEYLPTQVKCDIHPWMVAYWLILDHPYAAKTDETGNFTIEKLPVGTHEFHVWHERVGWIDRKFVVEVAEGANELPVVEVPVARFDE